MEISEPLEFSTAAEWRAWLEQNHAKSQGAWLVLSKKNRKTSRLDYDAALEEALCFGWIDGKLKSLDEEKFVLRFSPRKPGSLWSLNNRQKAEKLVQEGRMAAAGLQKIEEARQDGTWESAYTNRKQDEIPADLIAALSGNKAAQINFSAFANTYRNMYLYWVAGARTGETRAKRIAEVVERSAKNIKPGVRR